MRSDLHTPRHLRLPRAYRQVQDYLSGHDPDLRIRASVERPGWYVLERRCRQQASVNTAMEERTDIHVQARDGYIHVAIVHPEFLNKPWNIIEKLRDEGVDMWATSAQQVADDLEYEEQFVREARRRRRREDSVAFYREQFDILGRMGNKDGGNEKTRFSNPGLGASAPVASGATV